MALKNWFSAAKSFVLMVVTNSERDKFHGQSLLNALEGDLFQRTLSAFRETEAGSRLLKTRPDTLKLLADWPALEACPAGSLGRRYYEFMTDHDLRIEFYLDMVTAAGERFENDEEQRWLRVRNDSTHDLRHVLTGYMPDCLGEACLLSFRHAQLRHPGVLLLTLFAALRAVVMCRGPALQSIIEAHRRGRAAKPLDMMPWEENLTQPLSVQRATLGLALPSIYRTPFAPKDYIEAETPAINNQESMLLRKEVA